ncbi:MAG: hypothetical protein HZB95_08320 [Nitrosomonadales bacterium]|nr:hypothetical protein [Nitrosomonadales bacterium]
MGSINRVSKAGHSFQQPQSAAMRKQASAAGEQTFPPFVKQGSDELYLSSCRPTRLSMQLMLQARAQGK